jgi:acyl carrier protein
MVTQEELANRVLDCANQIARTALRLPSDGDLALGAFGFDSLSLFAFILELERTCGIKFDDALLNQEYLRSIRSAAALIALHAGATPPRLAPFDAVSAQPTG